MADVPDVAASLDAPVEGVSGAMVRRGAQMVRRHVSLKRKTFTIAVCGAAIFALGTVAQSFVFGWIVDHVITPRFTDGHVGVDAVIGGVIALIVVGAVRAGGVVLRRVNAGRTQMGVAAILRQRVVDRYQDEPLAYFQTNPTGELLAHVQSDAEASSQVLGPLPYACGTVMLVVISTAWMFATDWVLGVVALLLFPAITALNVVYQRRTEGPAARAQSLIGDVSNVVHESVDGVIVVKALGAEESEAARFAVEAERLRDANIDVAMLRAGFDAVLDSLPSLATILLVALGAWRVAQGAATAGEIVSFVTLFGFMVWPLRLIGFVLGDLPRSVAGDDRVRGVLAGEVDRARHLAVAGAAAPVLPGGPLAVRFHDVTFGYEGVRDVLDHFDVTIPAGRIVAVVGATGSGKSTFMAMLDRLILPDDGTISLGGVELNALADAQLRRSVALVFQEPFLFAGSVLDNIDLGAGLDHDAIARATAIAQVDEFVDDLPHGWATVIGERGVTLSGGQRQRVAPALALARQPQLLMLDDATSSVDPTTEARILTGLASVLSGTVITVASRPSTIALADDVLFVERGRVAGFGSHRELFAREAGYRRLVESYEKERASR